MKYAKCTESPFLPNQQAFCDLRHCDSTTGEARMLHDSCETPQFYMTQRKAQVAEKNQSSWKQEQQNKGNNCCDNCMLNGLDLYKRFRNTTNKFKTSCNNLDILLDGGIEVGKVLQFFGRDLFVSSITCMSILGEIIAGDENLYAVYIHTGGNFNCYIMKNILTKYLPSNYTEQQERNQIDEGLDRIRVIYAFNVEELYEAFRIIQLAIYKEDLETASNHSVKRKKLSLIVIDCVSHFLSFSGSLESIGRYIRQFAADNFISILITNHSVNSTNMVENLLPLQSYSDYKIVYTGDDKKQKTFIITSPHETLKPAVWNVWLHAPHYTIQVENLGIVKNNIEKTQNTKFYSTRVLRYTVIKSLKQGQGRHCYAFVNNCGIKDIM